jgi:spermidine/putrescine transport system ATP-binding protein
VTAVTREAIEILGVTKRFGDHVAVDDVSLVIHPGEFFSLLGPSGCGKTTTLRMLAGFEFPDAGRIRLEGADVTGVPANKRPVNLVFQRYELFPHMTVFQNVAYSLRIKRVPKAEIERRVHEALDLVGVRGLERRGASQLSGGQQQRVALARGLVNRPKVLLLDEPLSALDVKLRKRMQLELKSIQQEVGTTFVYVTHDQEEALLLSDRIGIMNAGHLAQVGDPRSIYERPEDPFVADFVGALNRLDLRGAQRRDTGLATFGGDARVLWDAGLSVDVDLAIRPEHVQILRAGSQVPPDATRLEGSVAEVIYLGAVTQYLINTPVGRLTTQATSVWNGRRLAAGETVVLTWPREALFPFAPAEEAQ